LNKYGAKRTNGYASKREAARAAELKMLERAGEISDLKEQVRYELIPAQPGERNVCYFSDFTYNDKAGNPVCEDVKGMKTPLYIVKRKLLLWVHGIKIREVK